MVDATWKCLPFSLRKKNRNPAKPSAKHDDRSAYQGTLTLCITTTNYSDHTAVLSTISNANNKISKQNAKSTIRLLFETIMKSGQVLKMWTVYSFFLRQLVINRLRDFTNKPADKSAANQHNGKLEAGHCDDSSWRLIFSSFLFSTA